MFLTRRAALVGISGVIAAPYIVRAAASGERKFQVIRDGDDMGYQINKVSRSGDTIRHQCDVELKVKVLGVTLYRYELNYVEEWKAGKLISLNSTCNDDGDDHFARVKRVGDMLEIDGSEHQGAIPGDAVTTSYWAYPFIQATTWISTQTGAPLTMNATKRGSETIPTASGQIEAEKWSVTGGYDADIYYRGKEWVAIGFLAGDERAIYVPDGVDPTFMPVWDAAT